MAGRPGRDRLTGPAAGPVPGRRRTLLAPHLALGALLGLGAVILIGTPSMFTGVVGLLLLGELVLLGLAASIGALYERFAPVVLVDVLIGTPVVAALTSAESLEPGLVMVVAIGIAAASLAASMVAAIPVRRHRVERILLAIVLLLFALAFWSTPLAAAVPVIAIAVVATPDRAVVVQPDDTGRARRAAVRRRAGRSGPPDAGAVLAIGSEPKATDPSTSAAGDGR